MGFSNSDFEATDWIKKFIDPSGPVAQNKSAFQRAHIVGEAFARGGALSWFRWVLGAREQNSRLNGVLAPQAQRGGASGLKNEALRGLPALLEFGPVGLAVFTDGGWSLKD